MDSVRRGPPFAPLDPQSNMRSNMQPPMTVKKSAGPSRMRQSFAGPQQFLGGPRQSLYPSQSLNVPPSAQKPGPSAYGRTPMRNSSMMQKSSAWGSGRQSMIPPTPVVPSHTLKDPRNNRDKSVQQQMRSIIFSWLQESQFQGTISRQTLLSPTAKDFRGIFEHLVNLLDPMYIFGEKGRKFEDEVVLLLKACQYPFADSIDKKWLAAPASMHSWPSLLAAIHWLSELCKARFAYLDSGDPTLQDVEQVPTVFDDDHHHNALAIQYIGDAYGAFLSGADDFTEQDKFLENRYVSKNETLLQELNALKSEHEMLALEYHRLTEKPPPIVELKTLNQSTRTDMKKFEEVIAHYDGRKKKVLDAIAREERDIVRETADLQKMREELDRLYLIVKDQNLSPEEVAQMNTEQEQLSRTLEELGEKSMQTSTQMRSLEVSLARRSDIVEQAIDEYTSLLDKLGLFPTVPPPLPPTNLCLEVNFASSDPKELVRRTVDGRGADLKNVIKVALDSVADYKRREIQRLADEVVNLEQELDEAITETEGITEQILDTEKRVGNIHEEAEAIRMATQHAASVSNAEAEGRQKALAAAKAVALANGVGMKSRLQALQFAYQEQIERVDRLKDETIRMILKSSNDMAAFKEEVSTHLNTLRQYTDEN